MAKYDYDAIIIGAGIGGLVCGCYLAKAGMKTLIVDHPGGRRRLLDTQHPALLKDERPAQRLGGEGQVSGR